MARVLIAEKLSPKAVDVLEDRDINVDVRTGMSREELLEAIGKYDGLIVRSATQVDEELILAAKNLKVVGRAGVGVDNVDITTATSRGVIVCNAPTSNVVSAAEQTFALMLGMARNTALANASMHEGKWERALFQGNELDGKTLAIFGLGRIGGLVADRARCFGMDLIGYDPYASDERAAELGITKYDTVEEILPLADFITVHLPKTKETLGMFSTEQYKAMKPGVYLVNAARGGIFDEAAVVPFLESGHVKGIALDVYSTEPPADSALLGLKNALLTPHLGASTAEAQERAGTQIASYVAAALRDEPVPTALNVARTDPESRATLEPYIKAVRDAGRLIAQIFDKDEVIGAVNVNSMGRLAELDTHILTTATLRGIFEERSDVPVNLVNADFIAEEQGLTVTEQSTPDGGDYVAKVVITARSKKHTLTVHMAVDTQTGEPRVVGLMDYKVDWTIRPHTIILRYPDRPGIVGRIGNLLGQYDVNINNLEVAPKEGSPKALLVMGVDQQVPAEAREILEREIVDEAYYIDF